MKVGYDEFHQYLFECLSEATARPAEAVDKRLLALLAHIRERGQPWTVLDYGCGNGVLLNALTTLPPSMVKLMQYVGLDYDVYRLSVAQTVAADLGLGAQAILADPVEYFSKNPDRHFDMVFVVNVLHEMPIHQAPWLLSALLCRLQDGGMMIVSDMSKLSEGESDYVCWDESNFVGFRAYGINVDFQATITQRTQTPVFTAIMALNSPRHEFVTLDDFNAKQIAEKTIATFERKQGILQTKMRQLTGQGKERTRDFAIYLTEFKNLSYQFELARMDKAQSLVPLNDRLCPFCQCALIYAGDFDIEYEQPFDYLWCPACTFEVGSHYSVGYDYIDGNGKPREIHHYTEPLRRKALRSRSKQALKVYGLDYILQLRTRVWNKLFILPKTEERDDGTSFSAAYEK
jgi:SAM-dependent methyltransferase